MFADDLDELHDMALKIGLKRSYFQNHKYLPHYDLTPSKRVLALQHGATEMTVADFKKKIQQD